MKLLVVQFSAVSCYTLPLRLTYLPQFNCTDNNKIFCATLPTCAFTCVHSQNPQILQVQFLHIHIKTFTFYVHALGLNVEASEMELFFTA
jgi:hypothetical protein